VHGRRKNQGRFLNLFFTGGAAPAEKMRAIERRVRFIVLQTGKGGKREEKAMRRKRPPKGEARGLGLSEELLLVIGMKE